MRKFTIGLIVAILLPAGLYFSHAYAYEIEGTFNDVFGITYPECPAGKKKEVLKGAYVRCENMDAWVASGDAKFFEY